LETISENQRLESGNILTISFKNDSILSMMNTMRPIWFFPPLLYLLAFASCGDPSDPEGESKTKASSSSGSQAGATSPKDTSDLAKAQSDAASFFVAFSSALQRDDSAKALTLVAEDHQYRFGIAYPFWQGCRFYDAKVVEVSGDLMRVRVSFEWPNGKKDREIKKLQRVNGKWRLQDS
jgi:hypothetical protein